MTDSPITPVSERKLNKKIKFSTTVKNTLIFAKRALIRMRKTPEQFSDVAIQPILFTLMFTFLFGGAVTGTSWQDYLPIIIPGMLVMSILTAVGVSATQIREDMDRSTAKRFKAMHISKIAPVAGVLIADLLRFAIAGTIVFIMGFILGYKPILWAVPVSLLLIMFVGWCFCWLFAWIGMSLRSATGATSIAMLIMFPLTFLSNAFVPSETLPNWLKFFVDHVNPLTKVISAMRDMLSNGIISSDFWFAILGSTVILVIFVPLTLHAYKKKI